MLTLAAQKYKGRGNLQSSQNIVHQLLFPINLIGSSVSAGSSVSVKSKGRGLFRCTSRQLKVIVEKQQKEKNTQAMVALILNCLIFGDGRIITIDIGDSSSVNYLKDEIARTAVDSIRCEAFRLKLYLAQRGGSFLHARDAVVAELSKSNCSKEIKELFSKEETMMKPTRKLQRYFDQNTPVDDTIHVLVQLPGAAWRLRASRDVTATYAKHLLNVDIRALNTTE